MWLRTIALLETESRVSAEESSPLEGSAGSGPERSLRIKIVIIAVALLFIIAAYAYVGTRGDTTPEIGHEAAVAQEDIEGLVCCTAVHAHQGSEYLLLVSREVENEYRRVAFRVMELAADGTPTEVNAIGSPFDSLLPTGFAVRGDTAYVPLHNEDQSGIWTVDLSDPEWPEDAGFTQTSAGVTRQLAAGGEVLAINHTDEIVVADISDGRDPEPAARIDQPSSGAIQLQVDDRVLYVNDFENDQVRVYDLSDPAEPDELGVHENPEGTGELPIEFGAADAQDWLDQTAYPGKYLDVDVEDGYGYIAASDNGLRVLDLAAPGEAEVVAELETPDRVIRVAVAGDRLYILGGSAGDIERLTYAIHIVDISEPESPELVSTINDMLVAPGLQSFGAGGGYVFAGLGEALLVFEPSP